MADLIIKISGDTADFNAALELVGEETAALQSGLSSMTAKAAIAFAALTAEVGLAVKSFAEAESTENKLALAMQNQGIYSDKLLKSYKDRADALQNLTGIDNDVILAAVTATQSLIGQREVTEELQKAILDLAVANNIAVESAAEMIAKGILGQTRALKAYGIVVDDHLTKEERMSSIIAQVSGRYADQAAKANEGIGSIKGLASAFDDLQKVIGERFAPVITAAIKATTAFTTALSESSAFAAIASGVLGAGVAITGLITILGTLSKALIFAREVAMAFQLSSVTILGPLGLLAGAVLAVGASVGVFATKGKEAAPALDNLNAKAAELKNRIAAVQAQIDKRDALFQNTNREVSELKALNAELANTEAQLAKLFVPGQGQDPRKATEEFRRSQAEKMTAMQEAEINRMVFEQEQAQIRADMQDAEGAALLEKQIALQELEFTNAKNFYDKKQALTNKAALTQALSVQKAADHEKEIEKTKNQEMVANRTAFLTQMMSLQSSGNQTLIAIGKAAAIASITIATADAAMKSYAFGAALGGPFLGGVFQGLALAAGAIQAAKVAGVSMADGGIVSGGIAGVDSVPAMLMPGEFVAPARDADAIIDAAARERAGDGGGTAHVVIELKDGLMDFIEAKLVERSRLGISVQGA